MVKIGSEFEFIESSVKCIKAQLKDIEDINPVVSIILDSVVTLEEEVELLRKRMEEENMLVRSNS